MRIDFPTLSQIPQLKALWQSAFGDSPEFVERFFSTGYSPAKCRCLTLDDQVTAALYWFDAQYRGQKFAYLYAIATHPAYRKRGLCRALMADTQGLLASQGYAGALLYPAGAELRQMYAGMGYATCCARREFSCTPGDSLPLAPVAPEDYPRLRRAFLPEKAAHLEDAALFYQRSYAQVWAGEGFLLTAVREGSHLLGLELLGNLAAAPGILAALGCKTGLFRTPGEGIPTVMHLPLSDAAQPPDYLGLVLD